MHFLIRLHAIFLTLVKVLRCGIGPGVGVLAQSWSGVQGFEAGEHHDPRNGSHNARGFRPRQEAEPKVTQFTELQLVSEF